MVHLTIRFTVNSWLLGVATIVGVRNVCSRTLNVLMTQKMIAHFSGTKPKMRDVLVKMRLFSQIKATCGISRTIVGRLTPMLASYTYTCIAPLGEYISMHVKGCCCLSLYVLDFLLICKSPDYIQLLFFVCKIMLPVHVVTFFILFKYSVDGLMYVTDLTKKTR